MIIIRFRPHKGVVTVDDEDGAFAFTDVTAVECEDGLYCFTGRELGSLVDVKVKADLYIENPRGSMV